MKKKATKKLSVKRWAIVLGPIRGLRRGRRFWAYDDPGCKTYKTKREAELFAADKRDRAVRVEIREL